MSKKVIVVGVAALGFILLLTKKAKAAEERAMVLEVSCWEFSQQKNIVRQVELSFWRSPPPRSLVVSLCSNPTTGFKWNETAQISDVTVMQQAEHNFVSPGVSPGVVGVPGKEVWIFNALKSGATTIKMFYSRPWEGDGAVWTYTLNVDVYEIGIS
jgi:predicted secreted protein